MALPVFPDIVPPMTPDEEPEDVSISTKMEDGIVVSRARYTRSRLTFHLKWGPKNTLPTADKNLLLDFYRNTVKGGSERFEWTCDSKFSSFYNQTFTVRFIGGPPKFKKSSIGYWSCSVVIQEA